MQELINVRDHTEAQCVLGNKNTDGIKIGGRFHAECFRKGEKIWTENVHNIVTTEGQNFILNGIFHAAGATIPATFFVGIFNTNTTPLVTHTYHAPGFTESTDYDGETRPVYTTVDSTAASMTNSAAPASFVMSGTPGTIYGAALFSINTKGDHTESVGPPVVNALYASGLFSAGRVVVADDVINVTYTLTTADDGV